MNINERIQQQTGLTRNDAIEQGKYILKSTRRVIKDAFDDENYQMKILISDISIDRDEEIVLPMSFKESIENGTYNGTVLFAHNHTEPSIAKMVDWDLTEERLIVTDQFAYNEYGKAALLWRLYRGGYMTDASVGFIPLDWLADEEEIEEFLGESSNDNPHRVFTECELLEHSLVPIGSNRNTGPALKALHSEVKSYLNDPAFVKLFEQLIEEPQKMECGHKAVYDAKGNIIKPCPICAEIGFQSKQNQERIYVVKGVPDEKPYKSEHSCSLRNEDVETCRRNNDKVKIDGKGVDHIYCDYGDDNWDLQAVRFPFRNGWDTDAAKKTARSWCNDHDGTFEPASEESSGGGNMDNKTVVSFQDLPLTDRDRDWNADAATQRVRSWAGGPDKEDIDWDKYRKAFIWYNSDETENFGSYKLPIADVIDGNLKAVPRGVFAVAVALQGGRGGVDITEDEIESAKNHIEKYYDKIDIEAPWNREEDAVADTLLAYKEGRTFTDELIDDVLKSIKELKNKLEARQKHADDTDTDTDDVDGDDVDGDDADDDDKIVEQLDNSLKEFLKSLKE